MTSRRIRLGRDATIVAEDERGLELESPSRLAPGRGVAIVRSAERESSPRWAFVDSWQVAAIGRHGPVYRGYCRWT